MRAGRWVILSGFGFCLVFAACVGDDGGQTKDAGGDGALPTESGAPDTGTDVAAPADAGPDADAAPCTVDASSPYLVDAIDVSVGYENVCAVRQSGRVVCWGRNPGDGLGLDAGNAAIAGPIEVALPANVVATHVTSGYDYACALDTNGHIWCWGAAQYGQTGSSTNPAPPTVVVDAKSQAFVAVDLAAFANTTCALDSSGSVWCWGYGKDAQFGPDASAESTVPVQVPGVSVLGGHLARSTTSAALAAFAASSSAYIWGQNGSGECAVSPISSSAFNAGLGAKLTQAGGSFPLRAISGGASSQDGKSSGHYCAVDATGKLFCWGDNMGQENGSGPSGPSATVTAVGDFDASIATVAAGGRSTCFLDETQHAFCMGDYHGGVLGNGTAPPSGVVTQVLAPNPDGGAPIADGGVLEGVVALSGGGNSYCAIVQGSCGPTGPGTVVCWGHNDVGQLGQGKMPPTVTGPVRVAAP